MIKFRALVVYGLFMFQCLGDRVPKDQPLPLEEYGTPDPAAPPPAPPSPPPVPSGEMRPL